jgi:hypothetical protein
MNNNSKVKDTLKNICISKYVEINCLLTFEIFTIRVHCSPVALEHDTQLQGIILTSCPSFINLGKRVLPKLLEIGHLQISLPDGIYYTYHFFIVV